MTLNPHDQAQFDEYAEDYADRVNKSIAVSGENKDYFARGRVEWTRRYLNESIRRVMDYGCGVGSLTRHLLELVELDSVLGVDVSQRSVGVARATYQDNPRAEFVTFAEFEPSETIDLAMSCNVFHHIEPEHRKEALSYIYRSLRPGGLFALWEQNPWNPGTRYIMRQCAFDKDAKALTPRYAKRLLQENGFAVEVNDFMFIFPRVLKVLRPLEPALASLPLGAQYLILARKPAS